MTAPTAWFNRWTLPEAASVADRIRSSAAAYSCAADPPENIPVFRTPTMAANPATTETTIPTGPVRAARAAPRRGAAIDTRVMPSATLVIPRARLRNVPTPWAACTARPAIAAAL